MQNAVLTKAGLTMYLKDIPCTVRYSQVETDDILKHKIDYGVLDNHCEIVHMELTNKCNMNCGYCYNKGEHKELGTHQWMHIIDKLSDYGVFQITFGGGEPLTRNDWDILAQYAYNKGLNLGMTTNGILLPKVKSKAIKLFKQINVSYHGNIKVVEKALSFLYKNKIGAGINFVMRQDYFKQLTGVKKLAKKYNAEILFLTYKPLIKDYEQIVEPKIIQEIANEMNTDGYRVAIDGLGCFGAIEQYCLQKKTFCDIDSSGNIYPCSFIRKSIGNLLIDDFKTIWKKRGEQEKCPFLEKI